MGSDDGGRERERDRDEEAYHLPVSFNDGIRFPTSVLEKALALPPNYIKSAISDACEDVYVLVSASASATLENRDPDYASRILAAKSTLLKCMETLYYLDQTVSTVRLSSRTLKALACRPAREPLEAYRASGQGGGSATSSSESMDEGLAAGVARFSSLEDSGDKELSKVQQLLLYVLNYAHSRGYARFGSDCYERRFTPEGHDTRAWRRVCTIKDLVYESAKKDLNFEQWLKLTYAKSNASAVIDYMTNCVDSQFPALTKDRHVFSFRNGVYVTFKASLVDRADGVEDVATTSTAPGSNRSCGHEADGGWCAEEIRRDPNLLGDLFLPYGEHDAVIPSRLSACKYFDEDFPEAEWRRLVASDASYRRGVQGVGDDAGRRAEDFSWSSVPTPHFDSILNFQGFDEDVKRWMCVMIGRLMYAVNELDGWQVVPYLKGQASSGKSTILMNICRNMYECGDVGVLSNNMERKFGISSLADKFLFVAPEIKADLQLEQAEFQSMVSGEALQLAVKYQQAYTVDWRVPGIMAGNEVPGWVDNAGSIGRRMVVFEFMRKVVNGDTELGKKLNREMGSIILKCNRAYHAAVKRCGNDNIWCHLPEYFKRLKADLTESTNPLEHFMNSGRLEFHPDAYMPMDALKRAFRAHCEENNFKQMRLTKDKYEPMLMEHGVLLDKSGVSRAYPRCPGGRMTTSKEWCIGADLACSSAGGGGGGFYGGGGAIMGDGFVNDASIFMGE